MTTDSLDGPRAYNSPHSVMSTLSRFTSVFSILRTVNMDAGSSTCTTTNTDIDSIRLTTPL